MEKNELVIIGRIKETDKITEYLNDHLGSILLMTWGAIDLGTGMWAATQGFKDQASDWTRSAIVKVFLAEVVLRVENYNGKHRQS